MIFVFKLRAFNLMRLKNVGKNVGEKLKTRLYVRKRIVRVKLSNICRAVSKITRRKNYIGIKI